MKINFNDLLDGKISEQDAKCTLVALHETKESVEDIIDAMMAMRARMIPVELPKDIAQMAIDNCGTGGDGLHTFNVSSIAAIILASLEIFVAKHGNKSVTSKSGSADMLEALGVKLNLTASQNVTLLCDSGFCFLFAQYHHPCMKFIMPIRKSLPHRTIFNILGPLCNPANVKKHLIGVFDFENAIKMAQALKQTGSTSGITVCSENGADSRLTQ
jgi:anthranilate phosphoribosyltransferase